MAAATGQDKQGKGIVDSGSSAITTAPTDVKDSVMYGKFQGIGSLMRVFGLVFVFRSEFQRREFVESLR